MTMDTPEHFSHVHLLATGGYGKVFCASEQFWEGNTRKDREVVIKKMDRLHQSYFRMSTFRELFILRRLQSSRHVVQLLSAFALIDQSTGDVTSVNLTLERMDMDVAFLLHQAKRGRPERWSDSDWTTTGRFVVHQLLCGLRDVHAINAVHRDIKPGNILVRVNGNGQPYEVKLADFGLARPLDTSYRHDGYLTNAVSTRWYRAPELLLGTASYTNAVDIWSVGCVLAEFLLRGTTLFPGVNDTDQLQRICHMLGVMPRNVRNSFGEDVKVLSSGDICDGTGDLRQMLPPHITQHECSLLESLLNFDPKKRPTAFEALQHPFFSMLPGDDDSMCPCTARPLHIEDESLCLMAKTKDGFCDALSYEDIELRLTSCGGDSRRRGSNASEAWQSLDEDSVTGFDAQSSVFSAPEMT